MAHSSLVDREMNVFHCVARIQGSRLFASYRSPFFQIGKRKELTETSVKTIEKG